MKDIIISSQEKEGKHHLDGRMMNWCVYISDDERSLFIPSFRRVCALCLGNHFVYIYIYLFGKEPPVDRYCSFVCRFKASKIDLDESSLSSFYFCFFIHMGFSSYVCARKKNDWLRPSGGRHQENYVYVHSKSTPA
jgi:hypothetical protein